MSSPAIAGVGYLIANDRLQDAAFMLIQPSVAATVPLAGISPGNQTVPVWDPSMYVGAQLVVGVAFNNIEVVTITAVVPGTSFTAVFAETHQGGEPLVGATFPVRQTTDALFTQAEMLAYLSTAVNDFLTDVPLIYYVTTINVPMVTQNVALPDDCQVPARIAFNNYPLRETSQANMDTNDYRWTQTGLSEPTVYFRDKVPLQNIGIWPMAGNTTPLEIVYAARGAQLMGLADGFPLPDPFTIYPYYRMLSFAFSKDGEMRNPALAKFFQGRYDLGVKAAKMFLDWLKDQN